MTAIGYMRRGEEHRARRLSLEEQTARIRAYCEAQTWALAELVTEGRSWWRPGLVDCSCQAMTEAFNFERDLLRKCRGLDRVVRAIADGTHIVSGQPVQYLIFELAKGNVRSQANIAGGSPLRVTSIGLIVLLALGLLTTRLHTKIKLLKRLSYGYRNVQVYVRKMLLGFLPTSLSTLAPHILT